MTTSELDSRNIAISMRKSVENLVISSQDAIGQSISQALTFSGVITQHSNQILQENRSVSRSPSPSLRTADGLDLIENDKQSAESIYVPTTASAGGGGDSSSVSSTEPATVLASPNAASVKSDNPKVQVTSPNAARVDGTRKKKSWYNALYPTYKSKSDDFKRIFKDLPDDERLIVDYSCALQKDILMHGRLYASQNYLCFYASIFGWETSLSLRWKDVTAITKEKTALVIPNAILVCTETEKNFLTSFSGRDKAYLMLFRVWQNALMDQPMSSQEIWQWVHSCYGEELGFNSDDEGYARDFLEDTPALPDAVSEVDLVDSSLMDTSGSGVGGGDGSGGGSGGGGVEERSSRAPSHNRDSSPPLVTNGSARYRDERPALPTDLSDTSDSEPDKPHSGESEKCTASHEGKVIMQQEFPFNIDQMFTMIFTNSKFTVELLAARNTTDYVQAQWQVQAGRKCRQCKYTLALTTGPIGPKEVQVTETQVMNKCSKPGVLYSIDAESENAGIPYADYFTVNVHYCLQRAGRRAARLSVYGHLRYKKTMWPMIKGFIEKNAISGLEEYFRLLQARLAAEAAGAAPLARKGRPPRRTLASSQDPTSVPAAAAGALPAPPLGAAPSPAAADGAAAAGWWRGTAGWLLATLLVLLAINALLYWRLYWQPPAALDFDLLQDRMSTLSGSQVAEWSRLLQQHSLRQRGQLLAWRDALHRTVTHLAQTEQALKNLLETIKPSLERAQQQAEQARDEL
ncbi:protein Aster-B-like isoform X3 [Galleria mellonella]|uniref:Protein Aster-B-like isoform X3 n=1 Tax=Galleria mellonella TaxID=7137 RepID=A0ABM3MU80_GALME|nr:protein Aster-B-like isoform X3 [Galleria mellonella]